ncbi:MAG: DUF2177 family protein [Xanthobacteraceae bacterium]|nr:DUF2177 family protein [Xanthobacteraceae bacterium]
MRYTIAYAVTAVVFLGVDYIWLSRAMGFYRSSLGDLLAEKPNLRKRSADPLVRRVTKVCDSRLGSTRCCYGCRRQNGRPIGRLEGGPGQSA